MNTPDQAPTHEMLRKVEEGAVDALAAIGMAIAHGIVLGVNISRIESEDKKSVAPGVALFIPGLPAEIEGEPDGPIRKLYLTIPRDGHNFMGLLNAAGEFCHGMLCKAQQQGHNMEDYFASKAEIEKCRRNAKPRIILPKSGRN